jgi:hypothetical protein
VSYTAPVIPAWGHSIDTGTAEITGIPISAAPGDIYWPSNNLALYVPFAVPLPIRVLKLWFGCGSIGTDNFDLGLFTAAGTKLVSSGATAKAASGTEVVVDVTDTSIGPGLYYIGLSCASTGSSFYLYGFTTPIAAAYGIKQEEAAHPLPATATMVNASSSYIPLVGMLIEATVA